MCSSDLCPICGKAWVDEIKIIMPNRYVKTRYEAKDSQPDEDGWETLYDTYDLLR